MTVITGLKTLYRPDYQSEMHSSPICVQLLGSKTIKQIIDAQNSTDGSNTVSETHVIHQVSKATLGSTVSKVVVSVTEPVVRTGGVTMEPSTVVSPPVPKLTASPLYALALASGLPL